MLRQILRQRVLDAADLKRHIRQAFERRHRGREGTLRKQIPPIVRQPFERVESGHPALRSDRARDVPQRDALKHSELHRHASKRARLLRGDRQHIKPIPPLPRPCQI